MSTPRRRPPGSGGRNAKNVLAIWAMILLLAAAQPQPASLVDAFQYEHRDIPSSTIEDPIPRQSRRAQPSRSPAEIPILNIDPITKRRKSTELSKEDDTNIAIARAQSDAAFRAPLAKSSEPSRRSSLSVARSLHDWEVENVVLLATIDGAIHARDRKTGQERWALVPDSPMIETINHRQNRSDYDDDSAQDDEFMFIVEPSKDGNLYIQYSDPKKGLQKLDATVRSLAATTPQEVDDPPLMYVASQETTMYKINAASGDVLAQFDAHNTFVNDNAKRSCRRISGFELDQPDDEPMGTLSLGRIQYTINIANTITNEPLCTIKYSEWTPNTRDVDLQSQHLAPLDRNHIQSFHDGRITGWDLEAHSSRAARFTHVLETPVARVFDVIRPANNKGSSAPLVILSQPTDPFNPTTLDQWDNNFQQTKVYVNQTGGGHWYAMSELSYPGVTNSASLARRFTSSVDEQELLNLGGNMEDLIGVHVLTPPVYGALGTPLATISGPDTGSDVALKPDSGVAETPSLTPVVSSWAEQFGKNTMATSALALMLMYVCLFAYGVRNKHKAALWVQRHLRRAGIGIFVDEIGDNAREGSKAMQLGVQSTPLPTDANQTGQSLTTQVPIAIDDDGEPISEARSRAVSSADLQKVASGNEQTLAILPAGDMPRQDSRDQSSDGDSDEDSKPQDDDLNQIMENGSTETKKRRTKRGRRGGKNNKKKKSMSPEALEEQAAIVPEVHQKDGMMQVGKLRVDTRPDRCLGHGSNGTVVFPGHLDGREVAVKRLIRSSNSLAAKEIKHLLSSDENPHVIRYFGKEESQHFTYIALDLFSASLDQVVEHPERYPDLVAPLDGLDVKDALRQITDGVQHLHSLKLVHRDIKPQNVLVRATKSSRPASGPPKLQFVISDFGLCKPLDEGPESTFAPTANRTAAGTTGWRAPELLVDSRASVAAPIADSTSRSTNHSSEGTVLDRPSGRRATKAIDLFSLGCVFYYVMTQGLHPFDVGGTSLGRDLNIKENRFSTDGLRLHNYQFDADDLILQMLKHDPRDRPDTATVLRHPYFWPVDDKLDFLCEVSDAYEYEKIHAGPASDEMQALEELGVNVIGPSNDFLKALPKNFITEMGKQRKYTGSRMIDLLRVIRNKKNHFHDLPDNVKELMMGGSTEGYYSFWAKRFPALLINCHCIILERDLVAKWKLGKYYA